LTRWLAAPVSPPPAEVLSGVGLLAVLSGEGGCQVYGDRVGIQPVYYHRDPQGAFRVSTHLAALLHASGHGGELDADELLTHLGFGYTTTPGAALYRGVPRLPPGCVLDVSPAGLTVSRYWEPPTPSREPEPGELRELARSLTTSLEAAAGDRLCLGLTAGKDSLCLAAAAAGRVTPLAATFGDPAAADQLQAERLLELLGWPHVGGALCPAEDFAAWARHIAVHSAGQATASYVDMARFLGTAVPVGSAYAFGENGESVRDFFEASGDPMARLSRDYMTPVSLLERTLSPGLRARLAGYPETLLARAREAAPALSDAAFANHFYRHCRMPGNFSLRHALLSPLRAKISPFATVGFLDRAYSFHLHWHRQSALHRALIAENHPDLLPYFDTPASSPVPVQDWPRRFGAGIGAEVQRLLQDALPYCTDYLDPEGTLALCRETVAQPGRAMYHLFRVLPFALFRQLRQEQGLDVRWAPLWRPAPRTEVSTP
jgi:hypothetical protein